MKKTWSMLGRRMTALLASMVLLAGVLPVQAAGLQMPTAQKAQMEVPSGVAVGECVFLPSRM